MDFEVCYDSIPMPPGLRENFAFRSKKNKSHRLKALFGGAHLGVAVGQGIADAIVDINTLVAIHKLIGNIVVEATDGQEEEFLRTVRAIRDGSKK